MTRSRHPVASRTPLVVAAATGAPATAGSPPTTGSTANRSTRTESEVSASCFVGDYFDSAFPVVDHGVRRILRGMDVDFLTLAAVALEYGLTLVLAQKRTDFVAIPIERSIRLAATIGATETALEQLRRHRGKPSSLWRRALQPSGSLRSWRPTRRFLGSSASSRAHAPTARPWVELDACVASVAPVGQVRIELARRGARAAQSMVELDEVRSVIAELPPHEATALLLADVFGIEPHELSAFTGMRPGRHVEALARARRRFLTRCSEVRLVS